MIDLSGKTALVTGGSRGIGKGILLKLAQAGADVRFIDIIEEGADEVIGQAKELGVDCRFYQGNITDFDACGKIIEQALNDSKKIDILVNNAGITRDTLFLKMNKQQWDDVININLTGVFNMTKAMVKSMIKSRYGRIVNVSSVVGFTGNPGQVNYSSSKAGLIGFTKSLAKEVASRNITCNAIAPGFIKTDMTDTLSDDQKKKLADQIPMKRMGTIDDVANGVLFFSSSLADYVTGTTLHINGGMF
jgi:3-oxoacyl-[acyl-carrier protein] reductase